MSMLCCRKRRETTQQRLHHMIRDWNIAEIKDLVERQRADIHAPDKEGRTALHLAATHCRELDVVQYLVEYCHAKIEATDDYGKTPLHCAIVWTNIVVAQYLVETCGANVVAVDMLKQTPLHHAAKCQFHYLQSMDFLVFHSLSLVNAQDSLGETALHVACRYGMLENARFLVERCGANVDVLNMHKRTALFYACCRNKAMLRLLVESSEYGTDCVNLRDCKGQTPLHFACGNYRFSVSSDWVYTGLLNFKLDMVQYLIEVCGAQVQVTNWDGSTPLHNACHHGSTNVVQYLVETCGASVHSRDSRGWTPLHHTCYMEVNSVKKARILLQAGADVLARDAVWKRDTALHLAVWTPHDFSRRTLERPRPKPVCIKLVRTLVQFIPY